ncbi:MAG: pyruvate carboxylase [Bacillus thermozeamaize]|uniref:Pyruvate carboxylase n=1 Tax=Bacillus thermozeamaize TaxID=230954 RepID=A0A1Y3PFA7_9BACI|nr:MAG: pyruvate carboxylase [Bacillus thermozeamaize]
MGGIKRFQKVLVANRGEIAIRVFRACTEMKIRTVAIYSEQDSASLHRFKADEAYLVGEGKAPIEAYLDIEGIIEIAKRNDVDAIHPGYGFLAENATFARRCEEEGITFIGPSPEHINMFGDKVEARRQAIAAGIPVIPGTDEPIQDLADAERFVAEHGLPIMIKAAAGGGGRGMRVVKRAEELPEAFNRARSEARSAFGDDRVYLEKLIERPKHIEVQILGDRYGNVVHLYERDCSIQRRHQKVVEVAPARTLTPELREEICQSALRLMQRVGYANAGTVEFLVTDEGKFYFIEVNPRIQVEHTITELITGVDLVRAQIRLAEGYPLTDPEVGVPAQEQITTTGYAIQCRITTEDPENGFLPDTGRLVAYRSPGGFGVRLDGSNGFTGALITPYYDSLLVKACTYANTFEMAADKMLRVLREFRIRGVKTNIPFLENVIQDEQFLKGNYDTSFIDSRPDLLRIPKRRNRGTKLLQYIGHVIVNERPVEKKPVFAKPPLPRITEEQQRIFASQMVGEGPYPSTKRILDEQGPEGLAKWVLAQKRLLVTDTTFRDAHQSLLATRVRTDDMVKVAEATSRLAPELFSLELWGGATFDVSMRFLKESPWERLDKLRERIPNILFQMLLRGSNAVGYTNYPDNLVVAFIKEAAKRGIDLFRIFDSLNWLDGMRVAIDAVRNAGKIAEGTICYTGDVLDPAESKYTMKYYVQMAKELEKAGAHILGIKDMAGLLKPYAAYELIRTLKQEVGIPIHLHTHDTSGNGLAMLLKAAEAGVDIVDAALSSMSGTTSQPSLNALVAALAQDERATGLNPDNLQALSDYWEKVREFYQPFESGMKASSADIYKYQMPGGQYTNLEQQAKAVGLGDRWPEVKEAYAMVNRILGDIVKVTPSSKMVGDFALFMVQNGLDEKTLYERGEQLDFPASVVDYFMGYMGQPYGGFPERLQKIVLKGREPLKGRPGELLPPVDFAAVEKELEEKLKRPVKHEEVLSYCLYPKVFLDYQKHLEEYGDVSVLDTPTFFYGLRPGEEIAVEIERGKTLYIKLMSVGEPQRTGKRTIYFELNGQPREIEVVDQSLSETVQSRPKADLNDPSQVGVSMPGKVVKIFVSVGDKVKKGEHLMVTEAMKMETTIQASQDGVVEEILVREGDAVEAGDLVLRLKL